jgi:hypothetical protein
MSVGIPIPISHKKKTEKNEVKHHRIAWVCKPERKNNKLFVVSVSSSPGIVRNFSFYGTVRLDIRLR